MIETYGERESKYSVPSDDEDFLGIQVNIDVLINQLHMAYCRTNSPCIYIYIYILSPQIGSLYHNSSVWLDTWDASSWDRNILTQSLRHSPRYWGNVLRIHFYLYAISYLECAMNEKSYFISPYVASDKFPTRWINPGGEGLYIYIYRHRQTDCFVVLHLFSVARHESGFKLW